MARGQRGILSGRHIRDGEEMRRRARSPVSVRARETPMRTRHVSR